MKFVKFVCLLGVLLLVFGCQQKTENEQELTAQKEQDAPEIKKEEAFSIEEINTFDYVCFPFKGSYENHEKVINDFWNAVAEQNITPAGPMFGIYNNSPEDTPAEDLSWEIGFKVDKIPEVQEPLVQKKWEFQKVVKAIHLGPYEETANMYPEIFKFIEDEGLFPSGPIMERFLDINPEEVAPEDLKTEIWVPVASMTKEQ